MFRYHRILCASLFATSALIATIPVRADAGTASGTMLVNATVLSFCTIATLPLPFGNYSSAVINVTTTLTVACTVGTSYTVALDAGLGSGANITLRKMTFGANTLNYGLYIDATHLTPFGLTGTNTVTGTAILAPAVINVYGQVPANQLVPPGLYSDTVTATVTY